MAMTAKRWQRLEEMQCWNAVLERLKADDTDVKELGRWIQEEKHEYLGNKRETLEKRLYEYRKHVLWPVYGTPEQQARAKADMAEEFDYLWEMIELAKHQKTRLDRIDKVETGMAGVPLDQMTKSQTELRHTLETIHEMMQSLGIKPRTPTVTLLMMGVRKGDGSGQPADEGLNPVQRRRVLAAADQISQLLLGGKPMAPVGQVIEVEARPADKADGDGGDDLDK